MKLTTTRNLIVRQYPYEEDIAWFDEAYPNIDPDQEVSLLDMLSNGVNTVDDVIWCLRATVQDSHPVAVELVMRCCIRSSFVYDLEALNNASADDMAICAADISWDAQVGSILDCDSEIERQRQDLIELLS